jgi:hypothetical protein
VGTGTADPTVAIYANGILQGGTVVDKGSGLHVYNGGTLSNVAFDGTLDLTPRGSSVVIYGATTFAGVSGTGPGTINVGASDGAIVTDGSATLDNATLNIGNDVTFIEVRVPTTAGATLTLGSHFDIVHTSGDVYLQPAAYAQGVASVINNGTITAGDSGGRFMIQGVALTNNGTITVSDGDILKLDSTIFTEGTGGSMVIGGGQFAFLQPGTWTNLAGTTLNGGDYEVDAASGIELNQNVDIATLDASVILNGAGSTIESFNTTSNSEVAIDSTLGTIGAAGALEIVGDRNWTTAIAMSNVGTLDLGGGAFTAPSLANTGLLSGFGVIAAAVTDSGTLSVSGGQTLSLVGGSLTNLSGTTLTGGTFTVGAGGTLQLADNVSIVTLKATIDLTGAGASVQSLNTTKSSEVTLASTLKTINSAGNLELLGGENYTTANTIANGGTIDLGGGTLTAAGLTNTGMISGSGVIDGAITDSGTITAQSGGTLNLQNATIKNQTGAAFVVDANATLQAPNNTTFSTLDFTVVLNGVGSVLQSLDTSTSTELTFEEGSTGTSATGVLEVLGGRSYTTTNALNNSGLLQLGGGTFTSGAMSQTAGSTLTGFGVVASAITDAGATKSSGGALAFTGKGDSFSAALTGTEVDFAGGTDLLQSGSTLAATAVGLSGGAVVTLATSQSYAGKLMQGAGTTLALGVDTLTLTASASTLAGSVTGTAGTLAFTGGSQTINTGAALNMANWSISGGTTSVNDTLTFKGDFTMGAGATMTLGSGDRLTLTGPAALSGLLHGASTLKTSTATVSGLTIGGTAVLSDAGTMTQSGAVTVGDKSTMAATLLVDVGATYTIEGGAIAHGAAATSTIVDNGTLIDDAAGTSVVAVRISDTGSLVAAVGTLDTQKALLGTGSITIDGGATMEADLTAASTLAVSFNGGSAVLALKDPSKFAAAISGFAPTDTIDLLGKAATSAVLGAGDTLVIKNGAKAVATLQLAGTYTGDTFSVASDGAGGTDITVSTGTAQPPPVTPVLPFIAAMAAIGPHAPASLTAGPLTPPLHFEIALPRTGQFA